MKLCNKGTLWLWRNLSLKRKNGKKRRKKRERAGNINEKGNIPDDQRTVGEINAKIFIKMWRKEINCQCSKIFTTYSRVRNSLKPAIRLFVVLFVP